MSALCPRIRRVASKRSGVCRLLRHSVNNKNFLHYVNCHSTETLLRTRVLAHLKIGRLFRPFLANWALRRVAQASFDDLFFVYKNYVLSMPSDVIDLYYLLPLQLHLRQGACRSLLLLYVSQSTLFQLGSLITPSIFVTEIFFYAVLVRLYMTFRLGKELVESARNTTNKSKNEKPRSIHRPRTNIYYS